MLHGQGDGLVATETGNQLTDGIVAIHQRCAARLMENSRARRRSHVASGELVQVVAEQGHAMGIDTAQIGGD
jgi:hypothetical protein